MTNRSENKVIESNWELQPARFDEHAHLKAQPVRPIPKSRMTMLSEKLGTVFTDGSNSLVLIVILGLLTGALIGFSLVAQNTSAPEANSQAAVMTPENQPVALEDAAVGVYGIQTARTNIGTGLNRRRSVPNNGQPRAYRFAVIR
ncbi:MAG TPA: hypothetical protein VIT88_11275 [Pyrinomonadaceae bacterium]